MEQANNYKFVIFPAIATLWDNKILILSLLGVKFKRGADYLRFGKYKNSVDAQKKDLKRRTAEFASYLRLFLPFILIPTKVNSDSRIGLTSCYFLFPVGFSSEQLKTFRRWIARTSCAILKESRERDGQTKVSRIVWANFATIDFNSCGFRDSYRKIYGWKKMLFLRNRA